MERLVEIQHQRDVGTDQAAHRLDDAFVVGKIAVAALDLDAAKTLIERAEQSLFVGGGINRAVTGIGPDRPRRSAQQRPQWLTSGLAENGPGCHAAAPPRPA